MKLILFVGSMRPGRMAERVAKLVCNYVPKLGDIDIITFDPLEKTYLSVVKQPVHFTSDPPANLVADQKTIESADGFLVVCGEYNRTIPPVCSAMLCNFPPKSYAAKPVICINYSLGQYGGVSATMSLRQFCTELCMIPLQSSINIPHVDKNVSAEGNLVNPSFEPQFKRAFSQFMWYARTMQKAHSNQEDPFPA